MFDEVKAGLDFQDYNRCGKNGVPGKENQHRQGTVMNEIYVR